MKKFATVSALALGLATMGAAWSHAQQQTDIAAPEAPVQLAQSRGGDDGGWRGHGGRERHARVGERRGGDHRGGHRRGGPGRVGPHGGMIKQLQAFDLDDDGSVTQAEIAQHQQAQLTNYDADKNGTLSLDEYQALWLDRMRERMVDAFQRHDNDGDAQVTQSELDARVANLVDRLDRDGDGTLNLAPGGERPKPPAKRGVAPGTAPAPQQ